MPLRARFRLDHTSAPWAASQSVGSLRLPVSVYRAHEARCYQTFVESAVFPQSSSKYWSRTEPLRLCRSAIASRSGPGNRLRASSTLAANEPQKTEYINKPLFSPFNSSTPDLQRPKWRSARSMHNRIIRETLREIVQLISSSPISEDRHRKYDESYRSTIKRFSRILPKRDTSVFLDSSDDLHPVLQNPACCMVLLLVWDWFTAVKSTGVMADALWASMIEALMECTRLALNPCVADWEQALARFESTDRGNPSAAPIMALCLAWNFVHNDRIDLAERIIQRCVARGTQEPSLPNLEIAYLGIVIRHAILMNRIEQAQVVFASVLQTYRGKGSSPELASLVLDPLISHFVLQDKLETVLALVRQIQEHDISLARTTENLVLRGRFRASDFTGAAKMLESISASSKLSGLEIETVVTGLCQLGYANVAYTILQAISVRGSITSPTYNAVMIELLANRNFQHALACFDEAILNPSYVPSRQVLVAFMRSSAHHQMVLHGLRFYRLYLQCEYEPTINSYNALIELFANAGDTETVMEVFTDCLIAGWSPNVHTYYAMLRGYSKQNEMMKISDLLAKLRLSRQPPTLSMMNQIAFTFCMSRSPDDYAEFLRFFSNEALRLLKNSSLRLPPEFFMAVVSTIYRNKDWTRLQQVQQLMENHEIPMTNSVVRILFDGYRRAKMVDAALQLCYSNRNVFSIVATEKLELFFRTLCASPKHKDDALQWLRAYFLAGHQPSSNMYNSLIYMAMSANDSVLVDQIFEEMHHRGIDWTHETTLYLAMLHYGAKPGGLETAWDCWRRYIPIAEQDSDASERFFRKCLKQILVVARRHRKPELAEEVWRDCERVLETEHPTWTLSMPDVEALIAEVWAKWADGQ
ncbi:uncharacterized protein BJ171DRAFT_501856 [Polychytrium aggregatum]|uniref:uncharacterized protein n=1 Tax=Polychytrium aggregatum TaxID=110093 RepID=UPI0022FDF83E|nr:uncharacterized protein BJ171DRAFT_501856 [Polychytrium aggregatum]KAI9205365.1 hypothetical protein BJ171DRAFT_501856 [Polychytrium aggregatum]